VTQDSWAAAPRVTIEPGIRVIQSGEGFAGDGVIHQPDFTAGVRASF
jgi:hypothetical protein